MTKFRRYLAKKPKGELTRLAVIAEVSHAQISRIANGHRGASLETAIALSDATGLAPGDFSAKVTTRNGKKPARSTARGRR